MAQLLRSDMVEPGDMRGAVEFVSDGALREALAVVGEPELGAAPISGVRTCERARADGTDL